MSPLNISLDDLITRLDDDLPGSTVLAKITEAQSRAGTLAALGDQLVGHYVAQAKEDGASWSEIGDAIGVSKQAAQQRHSLGAFQRFTDLARHSIVLTQEVARSHRHNYIGTEHLVLGLLSEPRGLAAKLMIEKAGDEAAANTTLAAQLGEAGTRMPQGHIPFTPKAKTALEAANRESVALGHHFVGTEHVLLGVMTVEDCKGAAGLRALGFDADGLRDLVRTAVDALMAQPRENTD